MVECGRSIRSFHHFIFRPRRRDFVRPFIVIRPKTTAPKESIENAAQTKRRLQMPPWPSLPNLPPLPGLPCLPSLPSLPSLPNISSYVYTGQCKGCSQSISIVGNLVSADKCCVCARDFCSKCIGKTPCPVPSSVIHTSFWPEKLGQKLPPFVENQPVCIQTCMPQVIDEVMEQFRLDIDAKYGPNIHKYLQNEFRRLEYFPLPSNAPEDTRFRQLMRFVIIAEAVASFTKVSLAVKAVKFAYQGNILINMLIANDMFTVLNPLMEALNRHGIMTGPSALLRLYYLGCKHTLLNKTNPISKSKEYSNDCRGVLAGDCPGFVLDYVPQTITSYMLKIAKSFYVLENDWSSWYLSKMIARQQYNLLLCINDTTKLPNSAKCPAFALLTRCYTNKNNRTCREALVIIRGSVSTLDWSINLEEPAVRYPFSYYSNPQTVKTVCDYMHFGTYKAALSMLDHYNLRTYLLQLLEKGYEVKVVGHSLGAAVASFLAAELRSYLIRQHHRINSSTNVVQNVSVDMSKFDSVHKISAVVFASPPYLGQGLADAFFQDRLCVNVVNDSDPVPRMSHHHLHKLGQELIEFTAQANAYMEEDKADLATYLASLGKASSILDSTGDSKTSRLEKRQKAIDTIERQIFVAQKKKANDLVQINKNTVGVGSVGSRLESTLKSFFGRKTEVIRDEENSNATYDPLTIDLTQESPSFSSTQPTGNIDEVTVNLDTVQRFLDTDKNKEQELLTHFDSSNEVKYDIYNGLKVLLNAATQRDIRTVTPGPILHLYRDQKAMVRASIVSHEHSQFQKIELLPQQMLTEHEMKSYRSMIDSAKCVKRMRKGSHRELDDCRDAESILRLFPSSTERFYYDQVNNTNVAEINDVDSSANLLSDEFSKGRGLGDSGVNSAWMPCSVCSLDVTWPYILHSEASRAMVSNTCSACGQIVCNVCAPAGDALPGDGLNQSYTVPDLRLPLPKLGLFMPQRVCLHCYSDSSFPGLHINNK